MTKTRKNVIPIMLALLLMCATFFAASFGGIAFADRAPDYDSSNEEESIRYNSIYFISDNDCSQYNLYPYIRTYVDSYCYYNPDFDGTIYTDYDVLDGYTGADNFLDCFITAATDGTLGSIEHALVIVELSKGMPMEMYDESQMKNFYALPHVYHRIINDESDRLIYILEDLFKTLKQNGCKIMFMCDTDEKRFMTDIDYDANDFTDIDYGAVDRGIADYGYGFLQYVDIHINTDMMAYFAKTVFEIAEEEYGFRDITLVLDYTLSQDDFLYNYFVYYILYFYADDPMQYLDNSLAAALLVLQERNVNVIFDDVFLQTDAYSELLDSEYIDDLMNSTVLFSSDVDVDSASAEKVKVYPMSSTLYGGAHVVDFAEYLGDTWSNPEWLYLFYDYTLLDSGEHSKVYGNSFGVLADGKFRAEVEVWFCDLIGSFVFNLDLTAHDNYKGICRSTFKTYLPGNGWLHMDGVPDCYDKDIYITEKCR